MGVENLFGYPSKREREEAKTELYRYFNESNQKVLANQAKLMAAIKSLQTKINSLQDKIDDLMAPQPPTVGEAASAAPHPAPASAPHDYPAQAPAPIVIEPAAPPAPAPFYASLMGQQLIPMADDMKEDAIFRVEPQSAEMARVEFNRLNIPTCLSYGPTSLENSFDCNIINKNPTDIIAEDTTTAHFEDGIWVIDGKIRVKFI